MTITKHYCDYCGAEMNPNRVRLTAAFEDLSDGFRSGRAPKENYTGEFCSILCAGDFIKNDGEANKNDEAKAKK